MDKHLKTFIHQTVCKNILMAYQEVTGPYTCQDHHAWYVMCQALQQGTKDVHSQACLKSKKVVIKTVMLPVVGCTPGHSARSTFFAATLRHRLEWLQPQYRSCLLSWCDFKNTAVGAY